MKKLYFLLFFVSVSIMLGCGSDEGKPKAPPIHHHTLVFIDKSASVKYTSIQEGLDTPVVNQLLKDYFKKKKDKLDFFLIHSNTTSAQPHKEIELKLVSNCSKGSSAEQEDCKKKYKADLEREHSDVKALFKEIRLAANPYNSSQTDVLGLIERASNAFGGTDSFDIKQIYVFSDMLQSTQNPARDMAKPFTSKDVAIAAAKQDIEWLEKNRTINKGNLQNVTVTVIPPDAAMSSGPGGAELRDYWSTVFTHFGMTMKW